MTVYLLQNDPNLVLFGERFRAGLPLALQTFQLYVRTKKCILVTAWQQLSQAFLGRSRPIGVIGE